MKNIIVKINEKIKAYKERRKELKVLKARANRLPFYKRSTFVTAGLAIILCSTMFGIDFVRTKLTEIRTVQTKLEEQIAQLESVVTIAQGETETYKYLYADINEEVASIKDYNASLETELSELKKTVQASMKYDANRYSRGSLPSKDLTKYSLLSVDEMNTWIEQRASKGSPFIGQGEAFLEASKQSGLDPKYLVAHAGLESSWGTSDIARDKNNMFGIGAFNHDPYNSAYTFSSFQEGIVQGAIWIKENYTNRGQNTLHSMIWKGPAYCQTDSGEPSQGWIDTIVSIIL